MYILVDEFNMYANGKPLLDYVCLQGLKTR